MGTFLNPTYGSRKRDLVERVCVPKNPLNSHCTIVTPNPQRTAELRVGHAVPGPDLLPAGPHIRA